MGLGIDLIVHRYLSILLFIVIIFGKQNQLSNHDIIKTSIKTSLNREIISYSYLSPGLLGISGIPIGFYLGSLVPESITPEPIIFSTIATTFGIDYYIFRKNKFLDWRQRRNELLNNSFVNEANIDSIISSYDYHFSKMAAEKTIEKHNIINSAYRTFSIRLITYSILGLLATSGIDDDIILTSLATVSFVELYFLKDNHFKKRFLKREKLKYIYFLDSKEKSNFSEIYDPIISSFIKTNRGLTLGNKIKSKAINRTFFSGIVCSLGVILFIEWVKNIGYSPLV